LAPTPPQQQGDLHVLHRAQHERRFECLEYEPHALRPGLRCFRTLSSTSVAHLLASRPRAETVSSITRATVRDQPEPSRNSVKHQAAPVCPASPPVLHHSDHRLASLLHYPQLHQHGPPSSSTGGAGTRRRAPRWMTARHAKGSATPWMRRMALPIVPRAGLTALLLPLRDADLCGVEVELVECPVRVVAGAVGVVRPGCVEAPGFERRVGVVAKIESASGDLDT
jgi:hypothetical protein